MELAVRLLAPRSTRDFLVRFLGLETAILGVNLLVTSLVAGTGQLDFVGDILVAAIVSAPFVVLVLTMLAYLLRLQNRLAELAGTDMLTGLPNRRRFLTELGAAGEAHRPGTLMILDVDHFKRVNDTFGHAVGDLCLQAVAERLRESVDKGDLVARIGGEEFAVYLVEGDRGRVDRVGARLTAHLRVQAGAEVGITLSAGAAEAWPGAAMPELMRLADEALYRAKAAGRAQLIHAGRGGREG